MSALFDWTLWWPLPGLPAVEATLLVGVAAILQRFIQSAAWRRTVWQACLISVVLIVVIELTGVVRNVAAPAVVKRPFEMRAALASKDSASPASSENRPPAASDGPAALAPAANSTDVRVALDLPGTRVQPTTASPPTEVKSIEQSMPPQAWLMTVWLLGTIYVLGRIVVIQLLFVWVRRDERSVADAELVGRVASLGRRLGKWRGVRLVESARFAGPIAFGVLRPTVGLPQRFAAGLRPAQQDVMLAHELAHLAAGDPIWYRLADLATGLLWWHPAVWWARRKLHAASEIAADEASLLVANGPGVLAECLVELGARLLRPRPAGWMAIEGSGFRSGLGRRVQRLVNLRRDAWSPPGRFASALARTLGPAALVLAAALCSAWTFPETSNKRATMKHWQQALSILTLATTFGTEPIAAAAETAGQPAPKPAGNSEYRTPANPAPLPTGNIRAVAARSPEGWGTQALREKLERIQLAEVTFDALPLSVVVEDLIRQSAKLDPEKQGVNFLFGQDRPPIAPPTIDPATGLPVVAPPTEEFDLRSVTIVIRPPLKNLRLIDVLEAIVKVADEPIKYSIEEYAVVFTRNLTAKLPGTTAPAQVFATPAVPPVPAPPPAPAAPLQTRAFKVNTNTFFASIERMFHIGIDPVSRDAGALLQEKVLPKAGVRLTAPESLVLYNPLTGVLLVRASAEELDAVQAAVETLGAAPVTGAVPKPSGSSSFIKHLAEGPHTHLHRAVTGVFDALGNLAPPPFNRATR